MSGIAGIINFGGAPIESGLIESMTGAMAHRGPDGVNHWHRGGVAMGQCMLLTTEESLEETQPLTNEDESLVLVMDGWLSNWVELREKLVHHGAILRDRSDAELVLKAYERWGDSCLQFIEGDFALVVWDAKKQAAFCARDRMGNKPLYYHWSGNTLAFASEMPPILSLPGVHQKPNEGMVAEFLAAEWYSRNETLWNDVFRLVAAHQLGVTERGPNPKKYWEPDLWVGQLYSSDEEYFEHYRELFLDVVRRYSRSNRTVAIEVSGGLDSSAVLCAAEHIRKSRDLPAPGVDGYTMSYQEGSGADELVFAKAVADFLAIDIQEIQESPTQQLGYIYTANASRDFPGFPNGVMTAGIRSAVAASGSRVLLTGEGGDAWLHGSRSYYGEEFRLRRWSALLNSFLADSSVYGTKRLCYWFVRHGVFAQLPERLQSIMLHCYRTLRGRPNLKPGAWLAPRMQELIKRRRAIAHSTKAPPVQHLGQRQLLTFLYDAFAAQSMERMEWSGAQWGVECRHPMNDYRFVQFAFSTPERLRLQGDRSKLIHVRAMAGLMPQLVLRRKDKAEFSFAFLRDLDRVKSELVGPICTRRHDWVRGDQIERMVNAFEKNQEPALAMWVLFCLYGCDKVLPAIKPDGGRAILYD
jgi:asparagine synthase (glutamine-hydrolysing)